TDLFVKRVYEGSVNMLIKGYIESGELSNEEIDALRKMLEKTK
ncbi:MAG: CopY/TcrY family copper transport repressor, partial [Clostridia bacterium]|nr:CopY/TcrY family copper transport repressor [Clostridia bacterium]